MEALGIFVFFLKFKQTALFVHSHKEYLVSDFTDVLVTSMSRNL